MKNLSIKNWKIEVCPDPSSDYLGEVVLDKFATGLKKLAKDSIVVEEGDTIRCFAEDPRTVTKVVYDLFYQKIIVYIL